DAPRRFGAAALLPLCESAFSLPLYLSAMPIVFHQSPPFRGMSEFSGKFDIQERRKHLQALLHIVMKQPIRCLFGCLFLLRAVHVSSNPLSWFLPLMYPPPHKNNPANVRGFFF